MSLFLVVGHDQGDQAARRAELLEHHLVELEQLYERVRCCGPLLDNRKRQCGGMMVIEADSLAEAERLVANFAYVSGGVWSDIMVTAYNPIIGTWLGGLAWESRIRHDLPRAGRFDAVIARR